MEKLIKVLIVDDSAYIRKVLRQMLSRSPFIEVSGTATNGKEALELVEKLKPDVVTCDLIMPELDGIGFIREQMRINPVPIVVVSIASESGELALEALDAGAVSFVQKPTALATERILEISDELIQAVKVASGISLKRLIDVKECKPGEIPSQARQVRAAVNYDIVVMGISTGGPQGLKSIIPVLPSAFPVPVAIVLHMPVGYTELYAQKLNDMSELEVAEAHEGEILLPGHAYIAPAGRHLIIKKSPDGKPLAHLDSRPFDTPHRPSVDVLFESAAQAFGAKVLGVVMTGMGNDGKEGCSAIKAMGGKVITESEETCIVYGMPRSVVEAGLSDLQVPIYDIAKKLTEII